MGLFEGRDPTQTGRVRRSRNVTGRAGSGRFGSGRAGPGRFGSGRVGSVRVGSGQVRKCSKCHRSSRVRSRGVFTSRGSGQVESGVLFFIKSHGSGRAGSCQEFFKSHGSGQVG